MIVKVLQKEKESREAKTKATNFAAGYDDTKFVKADGCIRGPECFHGPAMKLKLKPPVKGHHKLTKTLKLYEDASRFLADLSWKVPTESTKASRTTWLELFILFDTTGYRTKDGRTKRSEDVAKRAEKRKAANKHQRKGNRATETVEARASLSNELTVFKKVVRHIARQDADTAQAKWFHADDKPQYKRLKHLGVTGHQAAIAVNCEVDPITMSEIEEAIIAQKARCTPKQMKHYREAKKEDNQGNGGFLIRKGKMDTRSCPKWKRVEAAGTEVEDGAEARTPPKYWSCKVTCPVCKDQIETAQMQLFTPQGFRNINCSKCATQKRTKGWKCECGVAWHMCDIHRNDPSVHRSTKPQAAGKKKRIVERD